MIRFTSMQEIILRCVAEQPGVFGSSELAKMLVGSKSARVMVWRDHPDYGRLADQGRKEVGGAIDSLVQQGYLALDLHRRLLPGNARRSTNPHESSPID